MGAAMHDARAAFDSAELAAANGVGGAGWDGDRREAWLIDEYPLLDTCWNGMDEEHEKPKIATAAGFLEFFDMEAAQIELLAALLEDLPAHEWRLRWDVVSPGFLVTWARVLGRYAPPVYGLSFDEQKKLARKMDFFAACPRLILELLSTSWDGAFGERESDKDFNRGRTGAALVLTAVRTSSGAIRFIESAVELVEEVFAAVLNPWPLAYDAALLLRCLGACAPATDRQFSGSRLASAGPPQLCGPLRLASAKGAHPVRAHGLPIPLRARCGRARSRGHGAAAR